MLYTISFASKTKTRSMSWIQRNGWDALVCFVYNRKCSIRLRLMPVSLSIVNCLNVVTSVGRTLARLLRPDDHHISETRHQFQVNEPIHVSVSSIWRGVVELSGRVQVLETGSVMKMSPDWCWPRWRPMPDRRSSTPTSGRAHPWSYLIYPKL